jgi:hypothetical protein
MASQQSPAAAPQQLQAPAVFFSTSGVGFVVNDAIITLANFHPVALQEGPAGQTAYMSIPQVILHCSAGSAKDLYVALGHQIAQYEAKFGTIETEFTREAAAKKK